jgi:glucan biosynthesis protein C
MPVDRVSATAERTDDARGRQAWADNLKVVLVAAVIVAHATMIWTDFFPWVVEEPHVREPLSSLLALLAGIGSLFGMPLFFMISGLFTASSLRRKGTRRFLVDRALRLGLPLVFFVIFLAPFVEYVDTDNARFENDFLAFAPTMWWRWPPMWGPTWFLAVLLLFSTIHAVVRRVVPEREHDADARPRPHLLGSLAVAAVAIAVAGYLLRIWAPIGDEPCRVALAQAPGWVAGFWLGIDGAERGWLDPVSPRLARASRAVAWSCVAAVAALYALMPDLERLLGRGTWESALLATVEGFLIVSMSVWLIDVFRRRANHQGAVARAAGRAAFAAFVLHPAVLIALVLVIRQVDWAPEIEYVAVSAVAVGCSFALGALVAGIPGVSRIV